VSRLSAIRLRHDDRAIGQPHLVEEVERFPADPEQGGAGVHRVRFVALLDANSRLRLGAGGDAVTVFERVRLLGVGGEVGLQFHQQPADALLRSPQPGGPELSRDLLAVAQESDLFRAAQVAFGKGHRKRHRLGHARHVLPLDDAQLDRRGRSVGVGRHKKSGHRAGHPHGKLHPLSEHIVSSTPSTRHGGSFDVRIRPRAFVAVKNDACNPFPGGIQRLALAKTCCPVWKSARRCGGRASSSLHLRVARWFS